MTFTKRLLDLAAKIIYLLSGEDIGLGSSEAVKTTSGEPLTPHTDPHISGGTQNPLMEMPPTALTPEKSYKKILKVTKEITGLLMGEVPLTIQDVTVYFSAKESEYLEGNRDATTENRLHQGESVVIIKADVSEDVPPEISTDPGDPKTAQRRHEVKKEEERHIKEEDIPIKISADRGDDRRIKAEVDEEEHVKVKEEDVPPEISQGGNGENVETNSTSLYDGGTDDEITDDSSNENPIAPNSDPAPHSTRLSPDHPTHRRSSSDHSYPIPPRTDGREGREVPSSANVTPLHTCPLCAKSFYEKTMLRRHEKTHEGSMPYYCLECNKKFLHKSRFIAHRRVHTGEKPYPCSKCGKSFANKPDLVRHHRTHTGEKPFACPDCGKRFTQKVHLVSHQKKRGLQKH